MVQAIKLNDLKNRKRKNVEEENGSDESEIDISSTDSENEEEQNGEEEIVNIDFDFFGGNPEVDFHALNEFTASVIWSSRKYQDSTKQLGRFDPRFPNHHN